jgi:ubiquinone/menaquinone biosynthesis C-methylase UbiE
MTHDPKSLSRQRYGRYAQRYVESQTHAEGTDLDRLVAIADPQPGWIVLDVATGGGHTALRFAPQVSRVVATDLVARMLDAARAHIASRGIGEIMYAAADAEELPFPSTAFDLVTCRIAPHHFADCARFVRECARVLRGPVDRSRCPGGMLLIQDHVLPEDPAAARYIDAFERLRDPSHSRAYSQREWIDMFRRAGLQVTHAEQTTKRHVFLPWAARQDCTPATIERLVAMVDRAPSAVREWLQPRDFGTPDGTFANHHILIAGHRTA